MLTDLAIVCLHESAHAVVAIMLGMDVKRVLIDDGSDGHVALPEHAVDDPDLAAVALAGVAYQRAIGLPADDRDENDISAALKALESIAADPLKALALIVSELADLFSIPELRQLIEDVAADLLIADGWLSGDAVRRRVDAAPEWLRRTVRERCRAVVGLE